MIVPLLTLQTWLSPAFPLGSYAYSHGLERAIMDERIASSDDVEDWIDALLRHGSGWNDAVLLCRAWQAANDPFRLADVDAHARALVAGAERLEETLAQGEAFMIATRQRTAATTPRRRQVQPRGRSKPYARIDSDGEVSLGNAACHHGARNATTDPLCLPVAVGYRAACIPDISTVGLDNVCALYLQAFASNLVWIAARLVPLDQADALHTIDRLRPAVAATAVRALDADLDALGGCTWLADLASLEHERLPTRICRT